MTKKNKEFKIHPVDIHVGKKLRQKRLEHGISQDELANSVNLTFQQIQKYEKGSNRISSSKLFDFSKFLKTDIKYFFEGLTDCYNQDGEALEKTYLSEGGNASADYGQGMSYTKKEAKDLLLAYGSIKDSSARKNIIELVKKLSKSV